MVLPIAILTPASCCLLQHDAAGRSTACPHEFQRIVSLLPLGMMRHCFCSRLVLYLRGNSIGMERGY